MFRFVTHESLFRSLTNRPFALLWSGQTLSRLGDAFYQIGLAWWVLEKTGSAAAMATVLTFSFAPTVLFLLIGGVAVDRTNQIRVMLASDLARGVAASLVAALTMMDLLQIWHIYVISLLFGLVDAFFQPAYTAAVPALVTETDLPSANSLTSFSAQAGQIAGPPLGAALIALGGTSLAFAFNGLTFFISAAFLLPLLTLPLARPGLVEAAPAEPESNVLTDFREGIRTVRTIPWLGTTIALFALINVTLAGPYSVALPFLVKGRLAADVHALGILYTLFAIGYVVSGFWLGRLARIRRRGILIYGGPILSGLMLAAFGLPLPFALLGLAAVLNGAGLELSGLAWTNALQEYVPRDKLGRVASLDALGSFALLPIGYGLAGWATELLGAPLVFLLGGSMTAVIATLGLRRPAIRQLD
jgi:MFS family permease